MNYNFLISVIIPTYNSSKYVREAILSALYQTYTSIEIIVIDDGSTDNTCQIVEELIKESNKIKLIKKEHTGNVGKNSNEAVKISKGEFIAKLDSDDIWEREKLEIQIQFINQFKLICSNAKIVDSNSKIKQEKYFGDIENSFNIDLKTLLENNYIITSSILCEREIFEKYGGFEEVLGFRGEDYILWLKIASENKICFINKELISFRVHDKNLSHFEVNERYNLLENTVKIRNDYLSHPNKEIVDAVKKGNSTLFTEMARISFKNKDYEDSVNLYKNLIRIFPYKLSKQFIKILLLYFITYFFFRAEKLY
jgi:teichuronic acid biosynthesis glycosyltransferase TuaG